MTLFIPIEIGLKPKILIVINLILKLKELNLNCCINSLKKCINFHQTKQIHVS
jgi:hypothetical protein